MFGGIRAEGGCVTVGGTVGVENEGRGNKNFKKERQAGLRGGCLEKGGEGVSWNPLTNYDHQKL